MKIKFFNPNDLDKNLKATVHNSGKMGFTVEAAKKLSLEVGKGVNIGMNEENPNDNNLYVMIINSADSSSFRVNKAGNYFYISTKSLFDTLKYDYLKFNITFDISEIEIDGNRVFKFQPKVKERNNKQTETNE